MRNPSARIRELICAKQICNRFPCSKVTPTKLIPLRWRTPRNARNWTTGASFRDQTQCFIQYVGEALVNSNVPGNYVRGERNSIVLTQCRLRKYTRIVRARCSHSRAALPRGRAAENPCE